MNSINPGAIDSHNADDIAPVRTNSDEASRPSLSICITTFNRASFIGATLRSLLTQIHHERETEIIIIDGGSTDGTEDVVTRCSRGFNCVRYIKQPENSGIDDGYERAVAVSSGEYCWLMTDDDLVKPGAIQTVLEALAHDYSLVILNLEFRDFTMSKILQHRWLTFDSDRVYHPEEMDRLFTEVNDVFMYIGSIIIKRSIWLARQREKYYGSCFVHVGVIFQDALPSDTLVIVNPLVSYRMGNTHSYRLSEIYFLRWPSLIESLSLSEAARRTVRSAEPWNHPLWLLKLRAWGVYSIREYKRWLRPRSHSIRQVLVSILIALAPGALVNMCFVLYYLLSRRDQGRWLRSMRQSRYYLGPRPATCAQDMTSHAQRSSVAFDGN